MKCRNAGDCPIIHIKFPGSPALPPHGMKVMSEARKMMTSSQLCHPPGAVTAFPGTGLTTKRCSRPIGNRIPNGRESCSQGLGILFPAGWECWKSKFEYPKSSQSARFILPGPSILGIKIAALCILDTYLRIFVLNHKRQCCVIRQDGLFLAEKIVLLRIS